MDNLLYVMQMSIYSKETRTKTSIDTQNGGKREMHKKKGGEREIRSKKGRGRESERERDRDSDDGNTKW